MNLITALVFYLAAGLGIWTGFNGGAPMDLILGGLAVIGGLYFTVKIFTGDKEKGSENVS